MWLQDFIPISRLPQCIACCDTEHLYLTFDFGTTPELSAPCRGCRVPTESEWSSSAPRAIQAHSTLKNCSYHVAMAGEVSIAGMV